jgi:hypothetical protein
MTAAGAASPRNRGLDKPAGRQARLCGRDLVQVRYIARIDQSTILRFHK